MTKRKIEIFTAGCQVCEPTVKLVKSLACSSCEVIVYDLNKGCDTNECRKKAENYGITRIPAVAIDGKVLDCCGGGEISGDALKAAGVGTR